MTFIQPTTTLPRTRRTHQTMHKPPSAKISRRKAILLPLLLLPLPTLADHTYVAARRAYDRYHPRITSAIETLRQIRAAIMSDDLATARSLINDKVFNIKARRAFSIYATSFSDNYLGERSRALLKDVDAFYKELAFVAEGEDVLLHYGKAVERLREYYRQARFPSVEIDGLDI